MPSSTFTPQLRPLSIGEVLDAGFRLLRARFGTLIVCVLVPIVPLSIIATILEPSTDDDRLRRQRADDDLESDGSVIAGALDQHVAAGRRRRARRRGLLQRDQLRLPRRARPPPARRCATASRGCSR